MKSQRHIGFLCFDGMVALDITGPSEAFAAVHSTAPSEHPAPYKLSFIGVPSSRTNTASSDSAHTTPNISRSESGFGFAPSHTLATVGELDTVIVPGGSGLRESEAQARVAAWLLERATRIRRIASVCTGIYGLAPTGLLDGRRATTHWRFARDVAMKFPRIELEEDAIFIKDGPMYTSAGATAGIDLALGLIEEDLGPRVALRVARELVVYVKRSGGQKQYSEPLSFQARSADPFSDLVAWIHGNLHLDLTVPELARQVCLSPRQFSRKFTETFGSPPAAFVEEMRLNEACRRLTNTPESIEMIASSVGFKSADVFRRAMLRKLGVNPSEYRDHFG